MNGLVEYENYFIEDFPNKIILFQRWKFDIVHLTEKMFLNTWVKRPKVEQNYNGTQRQQLVTR